MTTLFLWTGAVVWAVIAALFMAFGWAAWDHYRMKRLSEAAKFADVERLAANARRRAQRVEAHMPPDDDSHAINLGVW